MGRPLTEVSPRRDFELFALQRREITVALNAVEEALPHYTLPQTFIVFFQCINGTRQQPCDFSILINAAYSEFSKS